jgi:hypothetical protein
MPGMVHWANGGGRGLVVNGRGERECALGVVERERAAGRVHGRHREAAVGLALGRGGDSLLLLLQPQGGLELGESFMGERIGRTSGGGGVVERGPGASPLSSFCPLGCVQRQHRTFYYTGPPREVPGRGHPGRDARRHLVSGAHRPHWWSLEWPSAAGGVVAGTGLCEASRVRHGLCFLSGTRIGQSCGSAP